MFNYSEQGRALTLLYGKECLSTSELLLRKAENHKTYLAYLAITVINAALFIAQALTALIVILAIFLVLKFKNLYDVKKCALDFEKDFATFLVTLAASLRCGNEPLSALLNSREMFPESSAVHRSVSIAKEAVDLGKNEAQIIAEFADNIQHPELALFRSAFLLARAEGGSLSISLERLAKVIRIRQSIRRKIMAALAMQKLSAYGICSVVIGLLLFQISTSKDQLYQTWNHSLGAQMLILGGVLILTGFIWMLLLTRSRI